MILIITKLNNSRINNLIQKQLNACHGDAKCIKEGHGFFLLGERLPLGMGV
jgi:hypothetical protein